MLLYVYTIYWGVKVNLQNRSLTKVVNKLAFLGKRKSINPTICNFRFFPSLPRTAASCAERIYGSTEIPLSFVNSPPSAGRRGRRGRRKYAEDFQRKDAKAQRREEFPDRVAFAASREKATWFY